MISIKYKQLRDDNGNEVNGIHYDYEGDENVTTDEILAFHFNMFCFKKALQTDSIQLMNEFKQHVKDFYDTNSNEFMLDWYDKINEELWNKFILDNMEDMMEKDNYGGE